MAFMGGDQRIHESFLTQYNEIKNSINLPGTFYFFL